MTTTYNLKKIRALLNEGFTGEELRRFCYDEPGFRPIYDQLAANTGKAEIIDRLLEHAEQQRLIEKLLAWAKEHNPTRYEEHQPYHESTITPITFQEIWKIQISLKPEYLFAGLDCLCLATKEAIHFLSPNDGVSLFSPLTTVGDLSLTDYTPIGGVGTPSGNLLLTLLPPNLSGKASLWSLKLIGQSAGQPKEVLCQPLYEAPSAQLSAPVIANGTIYLIQRGPELIVLDPELGQVQRTLPLSRLDNLHRDCVSFVFAAHHLCLALCNGAIFALDPQTGQLLKALREPDGSMLSPLATDGVNLFFGVSVNQRGSLPSRVCALDIVSGQEIWDFEMPPDSVGRYRSVQGQPLVTNDVLYVTGRNHFLHTLDPNLGQELWRYEMPGGMELSPVRIGRTLVIADRQRNVQALSINEPAFVVTCHYDLKTPPILNEWNPVIFTLINTGNNTARNVVLRLSGDFEGRSRHHTQSLSNISLGNFKRRSVKLKPTAAGATVYLAVMIDYQCNSLTLNEKIDLSIPVRRFDLDPAVEKETGTSPDGQWKYNYTALRALLVAALTNSDLARICFEYFQPVYDKFIAGIDKSEKISQLIEYVDQCQQVEQLLRVVQQRNPVQYGRYIQEIQLPIRAPRIIQPHTSSTDFDVFLAHNSQDKPHVEAIAEKLKQRGLRPWLDKEQIPPGRWFQDIIQQAIQSVKSAAIFIGPSGLGKWQVVELRSFISLCVDIGLPVIPVLLPGVDHIPEDLLFLKELNWVRFTNRIDDVEALDNFEWGITGKHP